MVCFALILCGFERPSRTEQLQQIGDRAHQSPLTSDVLVAAQTEAAEAASLLNLPEDWFDDHLAHLIDRASGRGAQLVSHLLMHSRARRRIPDGRIGWIAMFIATRMYKSIPVTVSSVTFASLK